MPLRLHVGYEMNKELIIQMAREAGLYTKCEVHSAVPFDQLLERFAALVAAAEREACAKVLDEMADDMVREMEPSTAIEWVRNRAAFIRARGETK